jgi:DNA polymerase-3 subunit alpha
MNYATYHLHTELSLLDSCTNYKLYVDNACELGQKAICFSEHGNTFNWVEKKLYCQEKGIKYMHGVEMYLTETLKENVRDNFHTVLIAKNYEGVKELNTLIDRSTQADHFY